MVEQLNAAGGANGKKFNVSPTIRTIRRKPRFRRRKPSTKAHSLPREMDHLSRPPCPSTPSRTTWNPDKQLLYLNYATADPVLTDEKCNYWHFRWSAHSDIKMQVLITFLKERPDVKKVYLINQDYTFGESVRSAARAMLKEKRPDLQIVGDEVHPLLKVNDFAPYVARSEPPGRTWLLPVIGGRILRCCSKRPVFRPASRLVHLLCWRNWQPDCDKAS